MIQPIPERSLWDLSMKECALKPLIDRQIISVPTGKWLATVTGEARGGDSDLITYTIQFERQDQKASPRILSLTISEVSLNSDAEGIGQYRGKPGTYRLQLLSQVEGRLETNERYCSLRNPG